MYEAIEIFPTENLSYPDYLDWKKMNTAFSSLDVYQPNGFLLALPDGARPVRGAGDRWIFPDAGREAGVGRDFYHGEDGAGAPRTAMLSYAAWRSGMAARRTWSGQIGDAGWRADDDHRGSCRRDFILRRRSPRNSG